MTEKGIKRLRNIKALSAKGLLAGRRCMPLSLQLLC